MKHRPLPGTDLSLSVVGFGAWAIGGRHWGGTDTADAIAAVHAAIEAGITWFDTAPIYGDGQSDVLLRQALGDIHREGLTVATKVGVVYGDDGHVHSQLTPATLREDLGHTLDRLGTDHVDLLQVHWPCEHDTPLEETFGTLADLRAEGLFRHLGVCNYRADALAQIRAITPIVSLQAGLSMLRREVEHDGLAWCRETGVGFLAYEPLGRGLLTGKYTHVPTFGDDDMRRFDDRFKGHRFEHARRLTADLTRIGRKVGVPPAAIAIGWVATRPGVTAVIAGARTPEQVRQNALAGSIIDHVKLWEIVDRVAGLHGGTPR